MKFSNFQNEIDRSNYVHYVRSRFQIDHQLKVFRKKIKVRRLSGTIIKLFSFSFYLVGVVLLILYFNYLISTIPFNIHSFYLFKKTFNFYFGYHILAVSGAILVFFSFLVRLKWKTLIYRRVASWLVDGAILLSILFLVSSDIPKYNIYTPYKIIINTNYDKKYFEFYNYKIISSFIFLWIYYPLTTCIGGTIGKKIMNLKITRKRNKFKFFNCYLKSALIGLPALWLFTGVLNSNPWDYYEYDDANKRTIIYSILLRATEIQLVLSFIILYFNPHGKTIQDWLTGTSILQKNGKMYNKEIQKFEAKAEAV